MFTSLTRSFPRFSQNGLAPNTLTVNDLDTDKLSEGTAPPYIQGIASVPVVLIVLGILLRTCVEIHCRFSVSSSGVLTLLLGLIFCYCRFCCNCCGKRRRTKVYKRSRVWFSRICILLNFGTFFRVISTYNDLICPMQRLLGVRCIYWFPRERRLVATLRAPR
jgi:hypothetical protein